MQVINIIRLNIHSASWLKFEDVFTKGLPQRKMGRPRKIEGGPFYSVVALR